jgi:hypothetical protein
MTCMGIDYKLALSLGSTLRHSSLQALSSTGPLPATGEARSLVTSAVNNSVPAIRIYW